MSAAGAPDPGRVAALFEALSDLDPAEAAGRLARECGADTGLRDAVSQLLLHDRAAAGGFLAPRPALLAAAVQAWDGAAATPTGEGPLAGSSRLGRYYVLQKLAEGGMGVIYVGYDDSLDRRVALKILRRDEAAREWLLREGQALGRLAHPNVVAVHEVGEHEGRVFLAMELIEGPTLRAWLDQRPRPFADTLRLFLQAGRGLAAAHQAGLVHRDFKPDNVLVGKDGRARVADFGIVARAAGSAELAQDGLGPGGGAFGSPLTQTGVLMGTPAFMAPEQLRGERATALSDQYSFCVALYRAAYGAAPHVGDDLSALARSVLGQAAAPPPRRAEVPAWLAPILLRGLERGPSLRFPSMADLLIEVERYLPRDPELDPTLVVRERLIMSGVFLGGYLLASVPMLNEAGARTLMRPRGLIAVPAILLFLMVSVIAWGWRGLSQNRYGRRLAGLFVTVLGAFLLHRLIGVRLGLGAEQLLTEDMFLFAATWALVAQTDEPWLGFMAALSVAATVAGALLPQRVPLIVGLLGLGSIVVIAARLFIDRHLSHEAVAPSYEDPREAVGSAPASTDVPE